MSLLHTTLIVILLWTIHISIPVTFTEDTSLRVAECIRHRLMDEHEQTKVDRRQ